MISQNHMKAIPLSLQIRIAIPLFLDTIILSLTFFNSMFASNLKIHLFNLSFKSQDSSSHNSMLMFFPLLSFVYKTSQLRFWFSFSSWFW